MKKGVYAIGILFVLLLVISCSQEKSPVELKINDTVVDNTPVPETQVIDTVVEQTPEPIMDPELSQLLSRNKQVTNIHYIYDREEAGTYEVYLDGNKAKKTYSDTKKLRNNVYYTSIYLDTVQKKAIAVCEKGGVLCSPIWNKAYVMDYELEKLDLTPIDVIRPVEIATEVGSELFEGKQLKVIEYTNADGKTERLSIDNYYGLPSRQVIYASNNTKETEHTFTKIEVGVVKKMDITLPEKYTIVVN